MEKVSDLSYLKAFTGGKPVMMKMFINTFFSSVEISLTEINEALKNSDWVGLKKSAHSFKPQLSYMGITALAPVILQIETGATELTHLDEMPALVDQVNTLTRQAIEELKQDLLTL